jgi:dTDP-4-amino-4,6-dideoxygalactose transaminase
MTNRIRIGRSLPPAAAPIPLKEVLQALPSCFQNDVVDPDFVKEIKQDFGQKFCLPVSSGKAGLVMILEALHILHPDRDEVVIPAFTCYSVPAAVKKAGLKVRLCDTGNGSLDYDKVHLAKIINQHESKILCVLITHLFGCPADFDGIKAIVGDTIPLVEDAAQAMGEEKNSKKLGTQGNAGFFSLGRGKALSTIDGGIVITNQDDIGYELIRLSKKLNRFTVSDKIKLAVKTIFTTLMQHPVVFWLPKSMPFLRLGQTIYEEDFPMCLMSSFQISLTHNWRKRLQRHQKARRENINFWQAVSLQNSFVMCKESKPGNLVRLPVLVSSAEDRDKFCQTSNEKGCGIMPTYPTAINYIPQISGEFAGQFFPNAQYLAEHLLTLPVHEYVRDLDRTKILDILNS